MAINNSRTGYLNGTTSGWAARSLFAVGSNLYAVVLDTSAVKIRVYKGTGNGTWTEQDSANAPLHSGATHSYDAGMPRSGINAGYIFVARRASSGAAGTVSIVRFNTATDTWETSDWSGANASSTASPNYSLNVSPRGSGVQLTYFYTGSIWRYAYSTGGVWGVRDWSIAHNPLSTIQTDNSDLAHSFASTASAPGTMYLGTSNSAFVDGARPQIEASVSQMWSSFGGYVNDGGTHRIAIMSRDSTGEGDFMHAISQSSPSFTTINGLTPTSTTDPGIMGAAVVPYNGQWHVIWSGDGRGEIHYDVSDDYVSPAFGADTTIVSGLSATDPAVYATTASTGVPVLYTNLASPPSVDIVWAAGAPAASGAVLAADISGAATVTASTLTLPHALAAAISGSSTMTASALTGQQDLAAAVVASSAATASTLALNHALAAGVTGGSVVSASLTGSRVIVYWAEFEVPDAVGAVLAADIAGGSAVTASQLSLNHPLTAVVAGTSTASADLTAGGSGATLAASIVGGSAVTASTLTLDHALTAAIAASSAASATRLTLNHAISAAVAGTSAATANRLTLNHALAGASQGASTVTAALSLPHALSAAVSGSAALAAALTGRLVVVNITANPDVALLLTAQPGLAGMPLSARSGVFPPLTAKVGIQAGVVVSA